MTAALLHVGQVSHVRHTPFVHRFRYRIWMASVDLHALAAGQTGPLRHNRAGLVAFHDRDHGPRDGSALLPWVMAQLAQAGLPEYGASIRFMAIPRVLGYAFNPIAFYFCHDAQGRLGAVLHQVKNTFGDQIAYMLPVPDPDRPRQHAAKLMHVSPFFDMQGGYRFAFTPPVFDALDAPLRIVIRYGTAGAPRMTAAMALRSRVLDWRGLMRVLAVMPLMPFKVVAAIHWQAMLLWLRGARYHPRPTGENPDPGVPA